MRTEMIVMIDIRMQHLAALIAGAVARMQKPFFAERSDDAFCLAVRPGMPKLDGSVLNFLTLADFDKGVDFPGFPVQGLVTKFQTIIR